MTKDTPAYFQPPQQGNTPKKTHGERAPQRKDETVTFDIFLPTEGVAPTAKKPSPALQEIVNRGATPPRTMPPKQEKPQPKQAQQRPAEVAHPAVIHLGFVDFDEDDMGNALCRVVVTADRRKHFRRDVYVGIRDREQDIEFLGRIVSGPYHTPHKRASEQATVLDSNKKQAFYAFGNIEILGQLIEGERVIPTLTRPRPYAEIYIFPDQRLQQFLGIDGDFFLGHLSGHTSTQVRADSTNPNFLPRNVGIFGTVGSGKSNTAQVIAEEAIKAGWAVVLVDVEGEYVRMNEPNTIPHLVEVLDQGFNLQPQGIKDFRVYVPSSGNSASAASFPFKVPISGLLPEVVGDILDFSEAETRVFGMITAQATRMHSTDEPSEDGTNRPYDLQHLLDGLIESSNMNGTATVRLLPLANAQDIETASVLRSKLNHLGRSNMLDWKGSKGVRELPVDDLLVGGRLSILDVSETDDRSRNIAIAYMLQELFQRVITIPKGYVMSNGVRRPPLLVIIEEVHTFVSRAAAPKMRAVLDNMQTISRRGRKRWMSLALVSQQPNHVPNEIFELANTRYIHQIKSPTNLDPVKRSTAGVDESLWSNIPMMGPGQCLLGGAVFKNPLFLNVRPSQSRRLHAS